MYIQRLDNLKFLVAVAETGSMLGGSKQLGTAQSNVSRVISELEHDAQAQLLVRSTRGVTLTAIGNELYQAALRIQSEVKRFEIRRSSAEAIKSHFRVGTYDSIARYFFPAFLHYLADAHPDLKVDLITGRSSEIVQRVSAGELSLGVVVRVRGDSAVSTNFHPVYEDRFELFQKSGKFHAKFRNTAIFYKGWSSPSRMLQLKESLKFRCFIEADNIETVKGLVEQGIGIGILPTRVAHQGRMDGALLPYRNVKFAAECQAPHEIGIQFNEPRKKDSSHELFRSELVRFLEQWSAAPSLMAR